MENKSLSENELDLLLKKFFLRDDPHGKEVITELSGSIIFSSLFNCTPNKVQEEKMIKLLSRAPLPIGRWKLFLSVFLPLLFISGITLYYFVMNGSRVDEKQALSPDIFHKNIIPNTASTLPRDTTVAFNIPRSSSLKNNSSDPVKYINPISPRENGNTPVPVSSASAFENSKTTSQKNNYNEIPELSPQEIEENNKLKKKMIRALLKLDKDVYAYIPPGTINHKGSLLSVNAFYIQKTEVSNIEYRTFLNDLIITGKFDIYLDARVIPASFFGKENPDALSKIYFSDPAYNDFPVVNISRKGAMLYCHWLTEQAANEQLKKDKNLDNLTADLRLPSEQEWILAAKGGIDSLKYAVPENKLKSRKGLNRANYNIYGIDLSKLPPDTGSQVITATASVISYWPNKYGLYNMCGNVAEMVWEWDTLELKQFNIKEKIKNTPVNKLDSLFIAFGLSFPAGTKGGSFNDTKEYLEIEGPDPYKGIRERSPYIGFRPVITYLGRKK